MNTNIELALNILYQRQLSTREQLLNEMLRVKLTLKNLLDNSNVLNDKEKFYKLWLCLKWPKYIEDFSTHSSLRCLGVQFGEFIYVGKDSRLGIREEKVYGSFLVSF